MRLLSVITLIYLLGIAPLISFAESAKDDSVPQGPSLTQEESDKRFTNYFQSTYIYQYKPGMNAAYSGMNSLQASTENSYTFSATAHLGWKLADHTEIFLDPEVISGVPFSALNGLGGFTNGEATRAQGMDPKLYRQRLFLRHTQNFGGDVEKVDEDINQFAQLVTKNRFVLTAGNFSLLDVMDDNEYAKDPRTQFSNWGNMTYAAFDYAADARGYGWGIAAEWYQDNWAFRLARMTVPIEPNMLPLDFNLLNHYGDTFEIERSHLISGLPGKVRVLMYRDRQIMARFDDATNYLLANNAQGTQAILNVRNTEQVKMGIGLNLEQKVAPDIGIFFRGMISDGQTETLAFTEADNSLSLGVNIFGKLWNRPNDNFGVAVLQNGLSAARRNYLQAGGVSFFIGDYAGPTQIINYASEQIFETYYSLNIAKKVWLSANYQRIQNHGYNAYRGPANFFGLRVHAEY